MGNFSVAYLSVCKCEESGKLHEHAAFHVIQAQVQTGEPIPTETLHAW